MAENKGKRRYISKECGICQISFKKPKKHFCSSHVPWYMSPAYACRDCQISETSAVQFDRFHANHRRLDSETILSVWFLLVNGFFFFIGKSLGLNTLNDLLLYVVDHELHSREPSISEEDFFFLRDYDRRAGLEPYATSSQYQVKCPNRISQLLHYTVLHNLVLCLDTSCREKLLHLHDYRLPYGSAPSEGHPRLDVVITDCHTHLDELFGRYDRSLSALESLTDPPVKLQHVIANYVFPLKWKTIGKHLEMDSRVSVTLGVHPHMLFKNTFNGSFRRLEALIKDTPKVVAIGEIGLDFTTACRCRQSHDRNACKRDKLEAQRQFLRLCLPLANSLGKPVVIHCRDSGNGLASKQTLSLFRDLKLTHLPVQRHCFIGKAEEFLHWSTVLPNCMFSLSMRSLQDPETCNALAQHADAKRLLLETDAPYLAADPTNTYLVAKKVSQLLKIPLEELISICNADASKFFRLKP